MGSIAVIATTLLVGSLMAVVGDRFNAESRARRRAGAQLREELIATRALVSRLCTTAGVPAQDKLLVFNEFHQALTCEDADAKLAGCRSVSQMARAQLARLSSSAG